MINMILTNKYQNIILVYIKKIFIKLLKFILCAISLLCCVFMYFL